MLKCPWCSFEFIRIGCVIWRSISCALLCVLEFNQVILAGEWACCPIGIEPTESAVGGCR